MPIQRPRSNSRWLAAVLALVLGARALTAGEPASSRAFVPFFAPLRVENAALAPDGRHLAYTVHAGAATVLTIVDVDHPKEKAIVATCDDRRAQPGDTEASPAPLCFLAWADEHRLVYAFAPAPGRPEQFFAVDADGKKTKKIVEQSDLDYFAANGASDGDPEGNGGGSAAIKRVARPLRVIGFLPDNADELFIEAQGELLARTTNVPTALFAVNVDTARLRQVGEAIVDGALEYDRQGNPRLLIGAPDAKSRESISLAENPRGWDHWVELDRYLGSAQKQFALTAENVFGRRAFPLGFDRDPGIMYFASNLDRDTYGIYALDLKAKRRTPFAIEDARIDLADAATMAERTPLIFDREHRAVVGVQAADPERNVKWIDPDLIAAQGGLERKFPQRRVRILGWSATRERFLVSVFTPFEPGRLFVYDRPSDLAIEFFRRDEPHAIALGRVQPFAVKVKNAADDDAPVRGWLALPAQNKINPPPFVVYCADELKPSDDPQAPQPDLEALARLGAIVARVDYRAGVGFGQKNLAAFRAAFDRGPVEDVLAAIAWVAAHHAFNPQRVAIVGQGFGGYVALRALQLHPERFRCAIAIDAPADLNAWLATDAKVAAQNAKQFEAQPATAQTAEIAGETERADDQPRHSANAPAPLRHGGPEFVAAGLGGGQGVFNAEKNPLRTGLSDRLSYPQRFADTARRAFFGATPGELAARSPLAHPERLTKPVLLIHDRDDPEASAVRLRELDAALKKRGALSEYVEVDSQFARRLPYASARVFAKIDEFFNLNLYNYRVDLGETKEAP